MVCIQSVVIYDTLINENLERNMGDVESDLEWRYMFQEAVWYLWNVRIFGSEADIPRSSRLACNIINRMREWRIAWQRKLLRQLQLVLDGDTHW